MIDPTRFDNADEMNLSVVAVNRKNAERGFFIDISVMPGYEEELSSPILECLRVERRDKDGKLLCVLCDFLTESEAWCWLGGFETATKALALTADDGQEMPSYNYSQFRDDY